MCTTCSQTFTRKASGTRHNSNLHFGTAEVVRLIDYVIGRSSGQYLPSNPRDFRLLKKEKNSSPEDKKYRQKTGNNKILDDLNYYSLFKGVINETQGGLSRTEKGIPVLLDVKKISSEAGLTQNSSAEYEQARAELATIEQMLTHFYSRKFAQDTITTLINLSNVKCNFSPIHEALERHRKNIRHQYGWI